METYPANINSIPHTRIFHCADGYRVVFGEPIVIPIYYATCKVHHRRLHLTLSDDIAEYLNEVMSNIKNFIRLLDESGKLYAKNTTLNDPIDNNTWVIKLPRRYSDFNTVLITGFDVRYEPDGPIAYLRTTVNQNT